VRETTVAGRQLSRSLRRAGFVALLLALATTVRAEIKVTNLKDGETLRYPIAFLRGTTDALGELRVTDQENDRPDGTNAVPVETTKFKILVVYMPIGNKVFEKLFYRLRTRTGNVFLPAPQMRESIVPHLSSQYLLGLVADQCPGNMQTSYWIDFMGRPTPFASGPEKGARHGHLPVIFASIDKPGRGHYHATMKLACMDAAELPEGELTREYVRYLESVIRNRPDMWLWSHRRWKHAWKEEYQERRIDEGGLVPG